MSLAPGDLARSPNPLAPHYSRFRVAERLLLTGHSHQAWPDVACAGQVEAFEDAAVAVDQKWERAFARAERLRQGVRLWLGEPGAEVALAPNTHELVLRFLARVGYAVPAELLARDPAEPNPASAELHPVLIEIYRRRPDLAQVCERLVDLDEGIQEWRYRHVKMVERTIGSKSGTGGSAGAEYLKTTLFQPLFPDLWAIRAEL